MENLGNMYPLSRGTTTTVQCYKFIVFAGKVNAGATTHHFTDVLAEDTITHIRLPFSICREHFGALV